MRLQWKGICTAVGLSVAAMAAQPALAAPVEYVRVCTAYGAGFYYIPGTDVCLRIGGYISVSFIDERNDFYVTPGFNVGSTGGYGGFGGSVLFGVGNTPLSVGGQAGVMFGRSSGSTFYMPTGGNYSANTTSIAYADVVANIRLNQSWGVYGGAGPAVARTTISGDGPGFNVSDTRERWGWAIAAGVTYALPNTAWSIGAEYRHLELDKRIYNIPGGVNIADRADLATFRVNYNFVPSGARTGR